MADISDNLLTSINQRAEWRTWLEAHHQDVKEIWLVYHRGKDSSSFLQYEESVEEALCFGWVDSLIKHLDDEHYARKFTPRKTGSHWSETNRRRFAKMVNQGRMTDAGLAVFPYPIPAFENKPVPPRKFPPLSKELEMELKSHPEAWAFFNTLTPSQRNLYAGWIMTAKKEQTQKKRLMEAVSMLEQKKLLGLK